MADLSFSPTAGLTINGISKATGVPTSVVKVTGSFAPGLIDGGDVFEKTFIVNGATTKTVLDLGRIVTGRAIWLECDGALLITLIQDLGSGPVDVTLKLEKFMYLQTTFTGLKVANTGSTARNLSVIVVGDRVALGTDPGVY